MKEPTDADREVGQRIRALRTRQGLSQTTLAQTVGVTFQQIQKYERGMNRLPHNRLATIATALACSVADLLGLDGEQANPALFALSGKAFALAQAYDRIPDGEVKAALRQLVHAHAAEELDVANKPDAEDL